jgi:hypothetical protein
MPLSLSSFLSEYPFEKCEDFSLLSGVHGVFVIICCTTAAGGIACNLLDYGGAVDLKAAIETNFADNNWHKECSNPVDVMVTAASPMSCETLLKKLQQIQRKDT